MKAHIFELRRMIRRYDQSLQLRTNLSKCEIKSWKNTGPKCLPPSCKVSKIIWVKVIHSGLRWCNTSNIKDRVWQQFNTPRRKLKIRCAAEYFWRYFDVICRCFSIFCYPTDIFLHGPISCIKTTMFQLKMLLLWPNIVFHVWQTHQIKITYELALYISMSSGNGDTFSCVSTFTFVSILCQTLSTLLLPLEAIFDCGDHQPQPKSKIFSTSILELWLVA